MIVAAVAAAGARVPTTAPSPSPGVVVLAMVPAAGRRTATAAAIGSKDGGEERTTGSLLLLSPHSTCVLVLLQPPSLVSRFSTLLQPPHDPRQTLLLSKQTSGRTSRALSFFGAAADKRAAETGPLSCSCSSFYVICEQHHHHRLQGTCVTRPQLLHLIPQQTPHPHLPISVIIDDDDH